MKLKLHLLCWKALNISGVIGATYFRSHLGVFLPSWKPGEGAGSEAWGVCRTCTLPGGLEGARFWVLELEDSGAERAAGWLSSLFCCRSTRRCRGMVGSL